VNGVGWQQVDSVARQAKRRVWAGARRQAKIARHGAHNVAVQAYLFVRRAPRRLWNLRKPIVRWRYRTKRVQEQLNAYRAEWQIEREIERVVSGSEPLVVGPWLSEVGYEVLYWVPFVRWVKAAFRIDPRRLVIVSRGGTDSWYADITKNYVEIFDRVTPDEFSTLNTQRSEDEGTNKQYTMSPLDRLLVDHVSARFPGQRVKVVHPSLMYKLFKQFWSGHRPLGFLDSHTRHVRLSPPGLDLRALNLPPDYVAVKFYAARSLPDTAANRRMLRAMIEAIAEQHPVVLLDTGLSLDDHADYTFQAGGRIVSVRPHLEPRSNLALQTEIIAGARGFVGTCGSLAWLAPMLGVPTTAVFTDARFLHSHLYAARRLYHVLDAGTFSPLDLSALDPLGLTLVPHGRRSGVGASTLP
jgi:hypothetical protein